MRKQRNRKRKKKIIFIVVIVIIGCILGIHIGQERIKVKRLSAAKIPKWIDSQIIDIDGISRSGKSLEDINDIVIHYVGNPGSSAKQNRDFYNSPAASVSSHFIVGLNGEIIQCIPLNEKSAASNNRNKDTISIEVCHPDDTGKFNDKTYNALVRLTAWLEKTCDLNEEHIIRHYDVTGKECPRYFVRHEDKWQEFKENVKKYRSDNYWH